MPKKKLTSAFVDSAKPIDGKDTQFIDTQENGLALRVTANGVKSWTYRYRAGGIQKRMSLGRCVDVSLAEARNRIARERGRVAAGEDPVEEAALAKIKTTEMQNRETVTELGEWYFKRCEIGDHVDTSENRPKKKSTLRNERYIFDSVIVPALGSQKLSKLTRAHIKSVIDGVAVNRSISIASKTRAVLNGLCSFCVRNDAIEVNPCLYVSVAKIPVRERILKPSELRSIWIALQPPINIAGATISPPVALSIQLAMVTLQRRAEVTGLHASEIDRENRVWIIPSSRTKNSKTHLVPLSDLAINIIDDAVALADGNSGYVFPSPVNAAAPINPNALTKSFGRVRNALDLEDMRPHDLRRTGATNLTSEALGFPRFIVSKVLNHTSDTGGAARVTATYDQNEYLSQKRRALDAWANRLLEIVEGELRADNVVHIGRSLCLLPW